MAHSGGITTSDALGGEAIRPGREERRQQAGFSIFLDEVVDQRGVSHWETRLYHNETGIETTLAGASPEHWVAWILERTETSQIPFGSGHRRLTASAEVASVEILEAVVKEAVAPGGSLHTVTAKVVLQLVGVGPLEREIGSQILRGVAASGSRFTNDPPAST